MIYLFILMSSLAQASQCPDTIMTDKSGLGFVQEDYDTLERTKKAGRCSHYYPNSPCVKEFLKKEPQVYNIICGAKK